MQGQRQRLSAFVRMAGRKCCCTCEVERVRNTPDHIRMPAAYDGKWWYRMRIGHDDLHVLAVHAASIDTCIARKVAMW